LTHSLYSSAVRLQKAIAKKVITKDVFDVEIKRVCGVDVSYKNDIAYCSAAVIDKNTFELIDCANTKTVVTQPYIPGLFMLREAKPIMDTIRLLKNCFELLLIDGHGRLHPRRCGLACYIGIMIDKPTIGVAKSLLCGNVREDHFIELDQNILGYRIKTNDKEPIYISVGHKSSLGSAIKIVKQLLKSKERIPEPLRIADTYSKNYTNFA
jgi:deoxyribonuclease V